MINEYLRKPSPERLDPKELDLLLGEITIMHSRAELYIRFLKRRVKVKSLIINFICCIKISDVDSLIVCFAERYRDQYHRRGATYRVA